MTDDLDTLGKRHTSLQKQLEDVRKQLVSAIQAEKERNPGVTQRELLQRSGYLGLETIRKILRQKNRS